MPRVDYGTQARTLFRIQSLGEKKMGDELLESLARVHVCVCR